MTAFGAQQPVPKPRGAKVRLWAVGNLRRAFQRVERFLAAHPIILVAIILLISLCGCSSGGSSG